MGSQEEASGEVAGLLDVEQGHGEVAGHLHRKGWHPQGLLIANVVYP